MAPPGFSSLCGFEYRKSGSIQCRELTATTASNGPPPGYQSSNALVSTSPERKLASRRPAMAASPAPSSTAVRTIPRSRQRHARLPGATADLGHPVSRHEPGQADQVVERRRREDRPGAVVGLRRLAESSTQAVALEVILHDPHNGSARSGTISLS